MSITLFVQSAGQLDSQDYRWIDQQGELLRSPVNNAAISDLFKSGTATPRFALRIVQDRTTTKLHVRINALGTERRDLGNRQIVNNLHIISDDEFFVRGLALALIERTADLEQLVEDEIIADIDTPCGFMIPNWQRLGAELNKFSHSVASRLQNGDDDPYAPIIFDASHHESRGLIIKRLEIARLPIKNEIGLLVLWERGASAEIYTRWHNEIGSRYPRSTRCLPEEVITNFVRLFERFIEMFTGSNQPEEDSIRSDSYQTPKSPSKPGRLSTSAHKINRLQRNWQDAKLNGDSLGKDCVGFTFDRCRFIGTTFEEVNFNDATFRACVFGADRGDIIEHLREIIDKATVEIKLSLADNSLDATNLEKIAPDIQEQFARNPTLFRSLLINGMNLPFTTFRTCDFSAASLRNTVFFGVSFEGSDLSGADFGGSTFLLCDFSKISKSDHTRWPEGFNPS